MTQTKTKEEVLIGALPYMQRYEGKTFVIKYGGAAMTEDGLKESFAQDVTLLRKIGINIVIIHGGGKEITELSKRLGNETHFVGGHRYTNKETLKTVMMLLGGTINKEIAGLITRSGGNAIGLCGVDNSLLKARKYEPKGVDIGLVGEVESVNTEFLNMLLANSTMPVIAPLGVSNSGEVFNINADVAAAAIASALGAEKLFFLSDTEGVLLDGELIPTLTNARAQQYIKQGVIHGGMIPKVSAAFDALSKGVKKVHLIDGRAPHSLLLEIFTNEGVGTQIIREEKVLGKGLHVRSENDTVEDASAFSNAKPDFLDFSNVTKQDLEDLFHLADMLKVTPDYQPLKGKTAVLLFQKPSLRTRVSFEVGIAQLGGTSIYLANEGVGLGVRESSHDVAKVLSGYADCVIARLFDHNVIEDLAKHASIPVVNALTDLSHPCQILADMYTIRQHNKLRPGMKVAFIGDGNNVVNSWLEMAAIYPMHFVLACPKGYGPNPVLLQKAIDAGISTVEVMEDPLVAADSADVLYSDVWTSMGQEEEMVERKRLFAAYQINKGLLQLANADALVMHCLPAHRGEEITDDAMIGANSVIFDQAENRLHAQKALLVTLLASDIPMHAPSIEASKVFS
jgi:ornithine carbamoyltransferase